MSVLSFLGAAARGYNAATDESDRLFKEAMAESDAAIRRAQERASGIQKIGQGLAENGNYAAAGKLLPQFSQAVGKGYGVDLPATPIVGSPVMARGMDKVEQQGPPQVPGGKLMANVPTPYLYDTGKREFGEESQAAIRGGLLLPKVKPEYEQIDPYKITYDKATGKIVREADENPYKLTAEEQMNLRRQGWDAAMDRTKYMGGLGITKQNNMFQHQDTMQGRQFSQQDAMQGRTFQQQDALLGKRVNNSRDVAASKAMEKKVQASQLIAQDVAKKFPWAGVQGVDPNTGDIIISAPRAGVVSEREIRKLESYMPGTVVVGDGRLMVTGTPDMATLRAQAKPKDPGLVADTTGTLVEKKAGVQVNEGVEVKKATRSSNLYARAKQLAISQANAAAKPGRPPTEEQIELLTRRIFNELSAGSGAPDAGKPDAAAELVEMMKADKAAKKGGR